MSATDARGSDLATDLGLAFVTQAAGSVALPPAGWPVTIVDYGADDHDALTPMREAVLVLRDRTGSVEPILVFHTVDPANDPRPLAESVDQSDDSYLAGVADVFSYMRVCSPYDEAVFPDGWVTLAWSVGAAHRLRRIPGLIGDHVLVSRATPVEAADWLRRARADWLRFLDARARELVPGGRLVVVAPAADGAGQCGAEGLFDIATEALVSMVGDAMLFPEELQRLSVPYYWRTAAECSEPFGSGMAGPAGETLELEDVREYALDDDHHVWFQRTGDAATFAAVRCEVVRWALAGTRADAVSSSRPEQAAALSDELVGRTRQRIEADPDRAVCRWRYVVMLVRKRMQA